MITCRALFSLLAPGESRARRRLQPARAARPLPPASALAILDAAKVDALDLGHGVADALGVGHAARDDEQLVLIGNAALERLDAVVDGLDDKLHALGLCQT